MNRFYFRTVTLLLVIAACCAPSLKAQDSIYVTVEHATLLTTDTFVDVQVFAEGYPEVYGLQLSLVWAAEEIAFEEVTFGSVVDNFNNAFNLVDPGQFRAVSTFREGSTSFRSDSLLLTLRFRVLPGFSGNTPISTDVALETEFVGGSGLSLAFTVQQGFVSYGEPGMRTSFSAPYADAVVAEQFCVDLIAEQAYAIAGFELELNWDAVTFPLADVVLGDNPLGLTPEEVQFSADRLTLDRDPEARSSFPAILDSVVVASLCFTTDDPDAVSGLSFGGGRDGNTVFGYSPTGEIITLTDFLLKEGTINQPEASGIFGPTLALPALKLYPNPVRDVVRLEGLNDARAYRLTLWDELGRNIRQENQQGTTLDLSSLSPGAYTLSVVQGNKRWLNRLVVAPK